MATIEDKIGYTFKNREYLMEALTHSSFANERHNKIKCNERMEFLGDAVLSIISADFLYHRFPDMPEGDLSKLRSSLVCTQSLSDFARQISLGDYLFLGKGESNTGGADRSSILENAFEALIAAVYLDGGMEPAKHHVLNFVLRELKHTDDEVFKDYKTALQEIIQRNPEESVNYVLTGTSGPDHDKSFKVEVRLNSNIIGIGIGKNKKQAEQMAAKEALRLMGAEI